jgi:hypothetical protein
MLAVCLAVASTLFVQKKEEECLSNAASAMQAILAVATIDAVALLRHPPLVLQLRTHSS